MAKSGFCSDEYLVKLVRKRAKGHLEDVTPFMMYSEEFLVYLEEQGLKKNYSSAEIVERAHLNWYSFRECEKERYKKLADMV